MEALRASRQDNPFVQQVIASRESLADCLDEVSSDNANLMEKVSAINLSHLNTTARVLLKRLLY